MEVTKEHVLPTQKEWSGLFSQYFSTRMEWKFSTRKEAPASFAFKFNGLCMQAALRMRTLHSQLIISNIYPKLRMPMLLLEDP